MTTPKERQGLTKTISPGVFFTADGWYLVRVSFAPGGDYKEAFVILDEENSMILLGTPCATFDGALKIRRQLRDALILAVAPTELLNDAGESVGIVYRNKVHRVYPLRTNKRLPPPELFKDDHHV